MAFSTTPRGRPRARRGGLGVPLALALLGACADPVDPSDDRACAALLSAGPTADAVDWFKTPAAEPRGLGRLSNEESVALAYALQERGAARVVAVGDGPGPDVVRAKGLVVVLPSEPAPRLGVFRLYATFVRGAGYSPRPDAGQKYLFLPADRRE